MRASFLVATLLVAWCGGLAGCGGDHEGDSPGECADGADNDGDGEVDCDDTNCNGSASCDTPLGPPPGTPTGAPTGSSSDSGLAPAPCDGALVSDLEPANGDSQVFYRTSLEARISEDATGIETFTLTGPSGAVPGTTSIVGIYGDGSIVRFEPTQPMEPLASYNVVLDWQCGPTDWSFSTSSTGSPVDPSGLVDRTYEVDLGSGRSVEPPGVGDILWSAFGWSWLLHVSAADAATVQLALGFSDGAGGQDVCSETLGLATASFTENPYFELSQAPFDLDLGGVAMPLLDAELSGAFTPANDAIDGFRLEGTYDVDFLADLVGSDPCALLVTFGVPCQSCPDGSGAHCVHAIVDSIFAPELPAVNLVVRTAQDIACDPSCGTPTGSCP